MSSPFSFDFCFQAGYSSFQLCGGKYPCCHFDEEAFLLALLTGGESNPCDPAYWHAPSYIDEYDSWSCEYVEVDAYEYSRDLWAAMWDDGAPPDVWNPEYWDCVTPHIDFETTDRECLPERYGVQDLLADCGPIPCIPVDGLEIPVNARDPALKLDVHDGVSTDWEDLVQCAWAILMEAHARGIVRFILCTLSGDPRQGDCIAKHLDKARLTINLRDRIGSKFAIGLGVPGSPHININTRHHLAENVMDRWNSGNEACACAAMACVLLHEIVHTCGRAMHPKCSIAEMMDSSLAYFLSHLYPELLEAGSWCQHYSDPKLWWRTVVPGASSPADPEKRSWLELLSGESGE